MASLLEPGSHRADGLVDDAALLRALVRVETAWMQVLVDAGAATSDQAEALVAAVEHWEPVIAPEEVEGAANPVLAIVGAIRDRVADPELAELVHAGLTSQDALDTALVLLTRDAFLHTRTDLEAVGGSLADLATRHRDDVMTGRTLTQPAVPITFGLKCARWLEQVLDSVEELTAVLATLPVQCGGAAGTLAKVDDLIDGPLEAAASFAEQLELTWPGAPWHTRRTPVTRSADAAVRACAAMGVIAGDLLTLGRPEIGEVREAPVAGRGGSSTMPHKQNPVTAVLVRSLAIRAPQLGAQLHLCATLANDERPAGAWHAEWPTLRTLLEVLVSAASLTSELVSRLEVDVERMESRAHANADALLAERGTGGAVEDYLGAAGDLVDAAVRRYAELSDA